MCRLEQTQFGFPRKGKSSRAGQADLQTPLKTPSERGVGLPILAKRGAPPQHSQTGGYRPPPPNPRPLPPAGPPAHGFGNFGYPRINALSVISEGDEDCVSEMSTTIRSSVGFRPAASLPRSIGSWTSTKTPTSSTLVQKLPRVPPPPPAGKKDHRVEVMLMERYSISDLPPPPESNEAARSGKRPPPPRGSQTVGRTSVPPPKRPPAPPPPKKPAKKTTQNSQFLI